VSGVSPGVVFVHGFLSSVSVWSRFIDLIDTDQELAGLGLHPFPYRSPKVSLHPLRRIPDLNTVADSLRTFLSRDLAACSRLALVSHSQGGLVVQRFIARVLADGAEPELARIRAVVMFACPNAGSSLALSLRRRAWFWRHPQERELRPLNALVADTQRIVLNRFVRTVPLVVYAGESDGVVPPASARSVFPDAHVLPGDHFSIVQPDSRAHRSYTALAHDLRRCGMLAPPASAPPAKTVADGRSSTGIPAGGTAREITAKEIVDKLLAVPGMADRSFRQRLYGQLPDEVRQQLPHHDVPRVELVGVASTLTDYRHLGAWEALVTGLRALVPGHPAVNDLVAALVGSGLIAGAE
jgi:hypothetical protein